MRADGCPELIPRNTAGRRRVDLRKQLIGAEARVEDVREHQPVLLVHVHRVLVLHNKQTNHRPTPASE
jgi:hypothetical protein